MSTAVCQLLALQTPDASLARRSYEVVSRLPRPWLELEGEEIDRALEAIGAWGDLVSPHLTGHSVGGQSLVSTAVDLCGLASADSRNVRRAGFIHDVGNISVRPALWLKAKPLNADDASG